MAVRLDTVGFPLDIGNKWYYSFQGMLQPSGVVVKTIIDTGLLGERVVRITRLGSDSTIGTEFWIVTNGSFYAGPVCLYNSALVRDSSYSFSGNGVFQLSIHLDSVTLFGSVTRCQTRSTYTSTWCRTWTEQRVAVGIGPYHDWSNGDCGPRGFINRYELIGLMKNGFLFGDTLPASGFSQAH